MATTISLTERAAERIRRHLADRGPGHDAGMAVRIGVKRTGCSGYAYTLDYADGPAGSDQLVEDRGVRIRVSADAVEVLAGTTVDYVREGLNEKFIFHNPNAGEACGCGESFSLRSEPAATQRTPFA
jgi:iron-sulfur cluster assembly protein